MLVDMHAHSSGISTCCKADVPRVLADAKEQGIDALVLCNHYDKAYPINANEAPERFAERYLAEYAYAKDYGEQVGVKVFFGIEATMERHDRVHMLIYGVDEDFVLRHSTLYDDTQGDLYRIVHESGGVLVQAHPMRRGRNVLLDLDLLDGVEINSHPKYDCTHVTELAAIARKRGILLNSGGDYHADTHRPRCGVCLPDDTADTRAAIAYLQQARTYTLCYQEPFEAISCDMTFEK